MTNSTQRILISVAMLAAIGAVAPANGSIHVLRKAGGQEDVNKGTIVAFPWVFQEGNDTSKTLSFTTAEEVGRRAQYSSVPNDVAKAAWASSGLPEPSFGNMPSHASLKAFGKAVHASKVMYGSISWHTRSIWVNAGPKTISTATVRGYVFDVNTGKVVFRSRSTEGRSDEKSNGLKIAGAILFTPLVTAVSGGPSTPQEQRAMQIGLSKAFQPWIHQSRAAN